MTLENLERGHLRNLVYKLSLSRSPSFSLTFTAPNFELMHRLISYSWSYKQTDSIIMELVHWLTKLPEWVHRQSRQNGLICGAFNWSILTRLPRHIQTQCTDSVYRFRYCRVQTLPPLKGHLIESDRFGRQSSFDCIRMLIAFEFCLRILIAFKWCSPYAPLAKISKIWIKIMTIKLLMKAALWSKLLLC